MSTLVPVVRYMVVCEKVVRDSTKAHPTSLIGLISSLPSGTDASSPGTHSVFYVFLHLTGCRGPGQGRIEIRHAESEERILRTDNRHLNFVSNPLALQALTIRIRDCSFPEPGVYDVQFWYNDTVIAQQPILAK